jgi:hypothetical protein
VRTAGCINVYLGNIRGGPETSRADKLRSVPLKFDVQIPFNGLNTYNGRFDRLIPIVPLNKAGNLHALPSIPNS